MKLEDIKVGETYYVRVKVLHKGETLISCCSVDKYGKHLIEFLTKEASAFVPITPHPVPTGGILHQSDDAWETKQKDLFNHLNGRKNTENTPKYDPCRKFRKGDKVRVVERHGRYQPNIPCDELWKGLCTVAEDEDFCNNLIKVRSADGREKLSHWFYLELITPIEELEPYIVSNDDDEYSVFDQERKMNVCSFNICHPNAEKAAEAECARLNAEYRKSTINN